eukprot:TRINITY_DN5675_c0_g1_i1.p1 TRINITY_DN5675_c0_g1~~TRINITY_DN5675_c0_g1_i1.p1  ORF type:complete len:148 (+),score=38.01 TRINITY_DN5675_c0_g1_i1:66-446(+)
MIKIFRQTINLAPAPMKTARDNVLDLANKVEEIRVNFEQLYEKLEKRTEQGKSCSKRGKAIGDSMQSFGEKVAGWDSQSSELAMIFLRAGGLLKQLEEMNDNLVCERVREERTRRRRRRGREKMGE